jgi:very-short-patch-repair endonuclease
MGWAVVRIWESEIRDNVAKCVAMVEKILVRRDA